MAAETMGRQVAQYVAAQLVKAGVYFAAEPVSAGHTTITVADSRLPLLMRAVEQATERLNQAKGG